jgi:uncharacterized protein (DUF1330 family)
MVLIAQLIYVHAGRESIFQEFEAVAIPLIEKHGGELLLRLRPNPENLIGGSMQLPYEIHLVRFPSDGALALYAADPERQLFLYLRNESVSSSIVLRGSLD